MVLTPYPLAQIWTQAWRGLHDETDIHSRVSSLLSNLPNDNFLPDLAI